VASEVVAPLLLIMDNSQVIVLGVSSRGTVQGPLLIFRKRVCFFMMSNKVIRSGRPLSIINLLDGGAAAALQQPPDEDEEAMYACFTAQVIWPQRAELQCAHIGVRRGAQTTARSLTFTRATERCKSSSVRRSTPWPSHCRLSAEHCAEQWADEPRAQ
jgi:hypothetical protein